MAGATPGTTGLINNPVIDSGTMSSQEMSLPGTIGAQPRPGQRDELTPIARYIAAEMNANAAGDDVKRMAEMNRFDAAACITDFTALPLWKQILGLGIRPEQCVDMQLSYHSAALIAWGMKVRQNGDWDHKPKIAARFHPRVPGGLQHWHLYGSTLYFYDVWSNIHYGYVGRAAGFSDATLLDGAGVEQLGSDLARLNLPSRSAGVDGLRAFDDKHDRAAIEIGIALYKRRPARVSTQEVLSAVVTSTLILKRPYAP
jgi:hypothetical protein